MKKQHAHKLWRSALVVLAAVQLLVLIAGVWTWHDLRSTAQTLREREQALLAAPAGGNGQEDPAADTNNKADADALEAALAQLKTVLPTEVDLVDLAPFFFAGVPGVTVTRVQLAPAGTQPAPQTGAVAVPVLVTLTANDTGALLEYLRSVEQRIPGARAQLDTIVFFNAPERLSVRFQLWSWQGAVQPETTPG